MRRTLLKRKDDKRKVCFFIDLCFKAHKLFIKEEDSGKQKLAIDMEEKKNGSLFHKREVRENKL